ncbi:uncharacterized protein LOC127453689 isoform X2 [Myxocyprinus asiaticus]|uniref:uncharacterized protein LOC127453689 isoform X2 n=1 Tax=Myxocyprinus asiaticus TaxID=70543 RepID=UPI002223A0D2|nr:uncharacterized protein LOC127453689 isoform X2 [Myxocyprinus asiaticus]
MVPNLLPGRWPLMSLILSGVLATDWIVRVPVDPVYASVGSSVVLSCIYDYPDGSDQGTPHKVLSEMWCLNQSQCITERYVYHSEGIFPEPSYQGRVQYFGQKGSKNCSLKISDLRSTDSSVEKYCFNHYWHCVWSHSHLHNNRHCDLHYMQGTETEVQITLNKKTHHQ